MEKKISANQIAQSLLLICCALMLTVVIKQQHGQSTDIQKIKAEVEYANVDKALEQKAELQSIKDELRVLAYNVQRSEDPSDLIPANETVERTKDLPLLMSSAIIREGRLTIRFGEEIQKGDFLFGVSLREGRAISNHRVKPASFYEGEIPHPLADQFFLVLKRPGTFQQNGQTVSGVRPIKVLSIKLTPIDEREQNECIPIPR